MKKYVQGLSIFKFFFILIYIFFTNFTAVLSSDSIWDEVRKGNKVILIRHSLAPGGGDPTGFMIEDCKTQRNLNKAGIEQSKKIGKIFKDNKISIDIVLSSEWCRCKDTAYYAFGKFKAFSALNSTFSTPYNENEPRQVKEIEEYLMNWKSGGKNLILITHYSIITTITNAAPSSGEIVIADKNLNVIGTIKTN
jgi:phosphohistidine phosphatase SixA|tara:strand:- start:600 stop:1181 length:582 start_codon:yes stop_codon:yes gene_type:complete